MSIIYLHIYFAFIFFFLSSIYGKKRRITTPYVLLQPNNNMNHFMNYMSTSKSDSIIDVGGNSDCPNLMVTRYFSTFSNTCLTTDY